MALQIDDIEIKALSACVPKKIVDNTFFEQLLSPKEMRMFEKTVGIKERRWAEYNQTGSDLGLAAASHLMDQGNIRKEDIGALIYLSQTSDYKIPFTSNILQHRLHLPSSLLCLDINAGCAGFVQGLYNSFAIAKSMDENKFVLFVVAETLSKIISHQDRSTAMLFGDGASALLIGRSEKNKRSYFNHFSDGSNYDAIIIPDGGYRNCVSQKSFDILRDEKNNLKSSLNLHMDGQRVFDFTLREVVPGINNLLSAAGFQVKDIDKFVIHQSNHYIIRQLAAHLGLPEDRMLINISSYGNTSGVSIPLVISDHSEDIKNSGRVMLSGYGSGLNWSNCILDFCDTEIFPIISI